MESLTLVTYSHTEYADIWPLVCYGISHLPDELSKVFVCEETTEESYRCIQPFYQQVLMYKDTQTYPQKLIQILEQISTPYVWLIHDIDIPIHIDKDALHTILEVVQTYDMDRCSLELMPAKEDDILHKDVRFTNIQKGGVSHVYLTPYDVGPSLWKRTTLLEGLRAFHKETYRTIEFSGIQQFFASKRIWALAPHPTYNSIYMIGRPFPFICCFLHILAGGKWYPFHIYQDLADLLIYLLEQFEIDPMVRGFGNGDHLDIWNRHV